MQQERPEVSPVHEWMLREWSPLALQKIGFDKKMYEMQCA
jgi:hypothetical protein